MTIDPDDPNTWPEGQKLVLRWIAAEGGWCPSWPNTPHVASRCAIERRLGVLFQTETPRGRGVDEGRSWCEPLRMSDKRILLALAERLERKGLTE